MLILDKLISPKSEIKINPNRKKAKIKRRFGINTASMSIYRNKNENRTNIDCCRVFQKHLKKSQNIINLIIKPLYQ